MASLITRENKNSVAYYVRCRYKDEFKNTIVKTPRMETKEAAEKFIFWYNGLSTTEKREYFENEENEYKHKTIEDLMHTYIEVYGPDNWTNSTYKNKTRLINNYIIPNIGKVETAKITPDIATKFVKQLSKVKAVQTKYNKPNNFITEATKREIIKTCKSAFEFAIKMDYVEKNPFKSITMPKTNAKDKNLLSEANVEKMLRCCKEDEYLETLEIAINIAYCTAVRMGELLGLTWENVHLDAEHPYIEIKQQLQSIDKTLLDKNLSDKIFKQFPSFSAGAKNILVLKQLKTQSSNRVIMLSNEIVKFLKVHRQNQINLKKDLGDFYVDYDLVIAQNNGYPVNKKMIEYQFKKALKKANLDESFVFHDLRHASLTYMLKSSRFNITNVQRNSGHSSANILMNIYAEVDDEQRIKDTQKFAREHYSSMFERLYGEINKEREQENKDMANQIRKMLESNPDVYNILKNEGTLPHVG